MTVVDEGKMVEDEEPSPFPIYFASVPNRLHGEPVAPRMYFGNQLERHVHYSGFINGSYISWSERGPVNRLELLQPGQLYDPAKRDR